jgi:hypothetical protein
MLLRQLAAIAALNLVALAPLPARATDAHQPSCALHAHRVIAVTPYRANRYIGKARVKQLRGAALYVEAEQHVSAQWLELELRRHLDAMRGPGNMADCPLDLDGIQVQVDARGPGFVVTLVAHDSSTAQEVLRRARLLLG